MIGIEIDGLPRSMYGDALGGAATGAAYVGGGADGSCRPGPSKVENIGWTESFRNTRQYTVLKKVVRLLQDNRLVVLSVCIRLSLFTAIY